MPVMVMFEEPKAAVLLAASVRTVDVGEDDGLKVAVTPLGNPEAVNATLPAKPPEDVTVIVDVPFVPWLIARLLGFAAMV